MGTVTISKKEYEGLKKLEKIDMELLSELIESFRDIKEGRLETWE